MNHLDSSLEENNTEEKHFSIYYNMLKNIISHKQTSQIYLQFLDKWESMAFSDLNIIFPHIISSVFIVACICSQSELPLNS